MKVRAVVSFHCAEASMGLGMVDDLPEALAKRLIDGGFVKVEDTQKEEPEKPSPKRKAVKSGDAK